MRSSGSALNKVILGCSGLAGDLLSRSVLLFEPGKASLIPGLYSAVGDEEASSLLDRALREGIESFDTAPHYSMGLSEQRMSAFASRMNRIYTKVGRVVLPYAECKDSPSLDMQNIPCVNSIFTETKDWACVWDFSRTGVEQSFAQSCSRLTTSGIYGLRVHDCETDERVAQLLDPYSGGIWLLREWRHSGKIKACVAAFSYAFDRPS